MAVTVIPIPDLPAATLPLNKAANLLVVAQNGFAKSITVDDFIGPTIVNFLDYDPPLDGSSDVGALLNTAMSETAAAEQVLYVPNLGINWAISTQLAIPENCTLLLTDQPQFVSNLATFAKIVGPNVSILGQLRLLGNQGTTSYSLIIESGCDNAYIQSIHFIQCNSGVNCIAANCYFGDVLIQEAWGTAFKLSGKALGSVAITGTSGQFSFNGIGRVSLGMPIVVSGLWTTATGSISGYSDPTTYYVSAYTDTTFTLVDNLISAITGVGGAITTVAGTTTDGIFEVVSCSGNYIDNLTVRNAAIFGLYHDVYATRNTANMVYKYAEVETMTQALKDANPEWELNRMGVEAVGIPFDCSYNTVRYVRVSGTHDAGVSLTGSYNVIGGGHATNCEAGAIGFLGEGNVAVGFVAENNKNGFVFTPAAGGLARRNALIGCRAFNNTQYGVRQYANAYRLFVPNNTYPSATSFCYYGDNVYQIVGAATTAFGPTPPTWTSGTGFDGLRYWTWLNGDPDTLDADKNVSSGSDSFDNGLGNWRTDGVGTMEVDGIYRCRDDSAGQRLLQRLYYEDGTVWNSVKSDSSADTPWIGMQRSRGTRYAPTDVQVDDLLGRFTWQGYANGAFRYAARENVFVEDVTGNVVRAKRKWYAVNAAGNAWASLVMTKEGWFGIGNSSTFGENTPVCELDVDGTTGSKYIGPKQWISVTSAPANTIDAVSSAISLNIPGGATIDTINAAPYLIPFVVIRNASSDPVVLTYDANSLRLQDKANRTLALQQSITLIQIGSGIWQEIAGLPTVFPTITASGINIRAEGSTSLTAYNKIRRVTGAPAITAEVGSIAMREDGVRGSLVYANYDDSTGWIPFAFFDRVASASYPVAATAGYQVWNTGVGAPGFSDGASNVYSLGQINTSETLTAAGAAARRYRQTLLENNTGSTYAITLAAPIDDYRSFRKTITFTAGANPVTLLLSSVVGGSAATTCTWTNPGDTLILEAIMINPTTYRWLVVCEYGVVLT